MKTILERDHLNQCVAVDPESGGYGVGDALSEAVQAARRKHPDRLFHIMRVDHEASADLSNHIRCLAKSFELTSKRP